MRDRGSTRDHLKGILVRSPDQGDRFQSWAALPIPDAMTQLETMAGLTERGFLSRPEFESQKERILRSCG